MHASHDAARPSLHALAFAVAAAFAMPAFAQHAGPGSGDAERRAGTLTNELVRSLGELERATPDTRTAREQRVRQIVSQRAAALRELAEKDPQAALLKSLPHQLRNRVPASAVSQVEQEVDATGVVVGVIKEDFDNHHAEHEFFLEVPESNRTRRLRIGLAARHAKTDDEMLQLVGRQARVRGVLVDDNLVVTGQQDIEPAALPAASTTPTMSPQVTGEQSTLVIMANFSDKANACSASSLNTSLFSTSASSVNGLYRETSRNNVSFSGKVIGPFNVNFSTGGACDYSAWGAALDAAATAAGHNLSAYKRISYAVPKAGACGWSGLAYVGGNRSWVNSCNAGVFAHELGHNLKFHHAGTPSAEYGDASDPMGGAYMVQFNAANRVMAGWQPTGTVQDVIGASTFTLSSTSLTGLFLPQVLRIRKADTNEFYYISMRTGSGYDLNLSGYKNLVSVHRAAGTLPAKTYVLAQLGVGQSYKDSVNGITITPGSIDAIGGGATVTVAMGSSSTTTVAACAPAAPTIAISPVSQTGEPGQARTYGVTVTNKDGSTCASSTFDLTQKLPSGFSGSFSATRLTLAPGASGSANWTLTPASTTADAGYTATVSATSGSRSVSGGATYVVYRTSAAPTVKITSPSAGSVLVRGNNTLSATAGGTNVKSVAFYVNGSLVGTRSASPYSLTWNSGRGRPGNYTLKAVAINDSGKSSENSITVKLK